MTTTDIRRWAMALPEVEETSHFRFHVPIWKVRGQTFLGIGKDQATAVFCISEQEAGDAATCAALRCQDARRSFLGLQVELTSMPPERIKDFTEKAWRQQAPKRLAAEHDRKGPASGKQPHPTGADPCPAAFRLHLVQRGVVRFRH